MTRSLRLGRRQALAVKRGLDVAGASLWTVPRGDMSMVGGYSGDR
jgi:hypothetical protein